MKVLVVQHAFSLQPAATKDSPQPEPKGYDRGQMITDAAEQQAVRDAGLAHFCTASEVADSFFQADAPPKGKAG